MLDKAPAFPVIAEEAKSDCERDAELSVRLITSQAPHLVC